MRLSLRLLMLGGLAAAVFLLSCLPAEDAAPTTMPGAGTETPSPSTTDGTRSTPVPLTPTPAAGADRPDCPQAWAVYEDPDGHFSLCYPADWFATSSPPQAYFGHTFSLRSPDESRELTDSVQMIIFWQETSASEAGGSGGACSTEVLLDPSEEVSMMLAGQAISACVGTPIDTEGDNPGPPFYFRTIAEIPLTLGAGSIRVSYSQREDIGRSHARVLVGILDSLQIEQ